MGTGGIPRKERKHVYPALGLKAAQSLTARIEYLYYLMHGNSLDRLRRLISNIQSAFRESLLDCFDCYQGVGYFKG